MRDYVNDWLAANKAKLRKQIVPHIRCRDGHTLSVQASSYHYCEPRSDKGPWTVVEVGYVAKPDGRSMQPRSFGNGLDIYGWVPVETVNKFIRRHGGFAPELEEEIKEVFNA